MVVHLPRLHDNLELGPTPPKRQEWANTQWVRAFAVPAQGPEFRSQLSVFPNPSALEDGDRRVSGLTDCQASSGFRKGLPRRVKWKMTAGSLGAEEKELVALLILLQCETFLHRLEPSSCFFSWAHVGQFHFCFLAHVLPFRRPPIYLAHAL